MNATQKGALYGALFTIALSALFTILLIVIDLILKQKGLPHMCFAFTETVQCTFREAITTRLKFMLFMFLVFVPAVSVFGGAIGYVLDKVKII